MKRVKEDRLGIQRICELRAGRNSHQRKGRAPARAPTVGGYFVRPAVFRWANSRPSPHSPVLLGSECFHWI